MANSAFGRGFWLSMLLCAMLAAFSFVSADVELSMPFYPVVNDSLTQMSKWATLLARGAMYFVLLFVLWVYFRFVGQKLLAARMTGLLLTVLAVNYSLCGILKTLIGRARPILYFDEQVSGFYGPGFNDNFWSFPSGHVTIIFSLAFFLYWLRPKMAWLVFPLAFIIALTRVVLLQHYASDIFATILMTGLGSYMVIRLYEEHVLP